MVDEQRPYLLPRDAVPRPPQAGQFVTWQGERAPVLGPLLPQPERQPDPITDLVADLVRRFDPGGYRLQCPVADCGWGLHVPRMELDPLELVDGDSYVTHVEAVPREDVELILRVHVELHAVLTETDARDAPLPSEPDAFDLRTRRCRFCFDAVQQFRDGWANGAGQFECPNGQHCHIPVLTP